MAFSGGQSRPTLATEDKRGLGHPDAASSLGAEMGAGDVEGNAGESSGQNVTEDATDAWSLTLSM